MAKFIDFAELKERTPIESVIDLLGLNMKQHGNQWRGPCPSGKGGERALVVTPEKKAWYSFGVKKGGDVIALVAFVKDLKPREAAEFLSGQSVPEEKEEPTERAERGFRPLDYLEPDHEAVEAVGFLSADAARLGVGYAKRGVLRGTVAVPVRLEDGTLVGYLGITEASLPPRWNF